MRLLPFSLLISSAGTDGATLTASRLLFSGLPLEVSSSHAMVVIKKAPDLTCAGHRIIQSTRLLSFFAAPEANMRGRLSDGYITMKLNKTHFIYSGHH